MMDDFDILRELFKENALARVEKDEIILEEQNNQSSYTLNITRAPYDTIAFKADMFPAPGNIFKGDRGECKRADYVIFTREDGRKRIVYVEMKEGTGGTNRDIELQLRGAKCLVAYCRAIVQEFWKENRFLENYAERFVSVRNIRIDKRPTRGLKTPVHDAPEKMLRLTAPKGILQFNELVSKGR